jgi:RNA polymerase sigma-70 factor (ECF subfamily)
VNRELLEKHMQDLRADRNALDGVYGMTSRGVYLLARSVLRDAEAAKDVMQETYMRVVANIDKYEPDTNAAAWIMRIARNAAYRRYGEQKRRRAGEVNLDSLGDSVSDGKDHESVWTDDMELNGAMLRLNPEEREIVTLFALDGYKHREIAEILGKPQGTVQWKYNKAIKKLRKFLEEE